MTRARKFFGGRSWRKFVSNRLAVASLLVIGVYFAVAVAGFAGAISREDTQIRVLPDRTPGFLERSPLDKRALDASWLIQRTESRLRRAQASPEMYAELMDELRLAERRMADVPIDEMVALLGAASDRLDELYGVMDEYDDLLDDILDLELDLRDLPAGDPRRDEIRAEIEAMRARVPEARAPVEERMRAVERAVLAMQPIPEGFAGFWYRLRTFLGSDAQGRSISMKALFSVRIAFQIGFLVAVVCVMIGTIMGATAGFFGGWVDYVVMYVVSVLSSIPTLVLLGVLVYMFFGHPLFDNPAERPGLALVPVYCAMCLTFWVSTCRVIRGEVMKIKSLEYVQAATSIGFGRLYILFRHVVPNTIHIMFINLSLLFIGAIKSEVVLSFLGLGVKGQPSWGVMINQAKDDISVLFFWEVVSASVLMFGLVLAFNIVSDALQDAFDPKHVG